MNFNNKFDIYEKFVKSYNTFGFDFNINIARLFLCFFLIWKLLSRDFSFYGYIPNDVFGFYPIEIYSPLTIVWWTGTSVITDIFTMHWIHWFIDRPTPETLEIIQILSITVLILFAIFGRGPKKIFALISYLLLIYLWGHLFLLGQEIDSVALYFGIFLVLIFSNYNDAPIWKFKDIFFMKKNINAGKTISLMYLVFVAYYFSSGLNKLTDITILEWFKYDLIFTIKKMWLSSKYTSIYVPDIFQHLFFLEYWGNLFPSIVYVSHLIVPVVFFNRSKVVYFFLFYALFHFMTFGVGISFTGYILVWGCLFHYREWFSRKNLNNGF